MNAGIVILIVLGIIILLAGLGVGLYFLLRKKPAAPPNSFEPLQPSGATGTNGGGSGGGGSNGGGSSGGGSGGGGATGGTSQSPISIQGVDDDSIYWTYEVDQGINPGRGLGAYPRSGNSPDAVCITNSFRHQNITQGIITLNNAIVFPVAGVTNVVCGSDITGNVTGTVANYPLNTITSAFTNPGQNCSWIYDSRSDKKTWCLASNPNICVFQNQASLSTQRLPNPIPATFQWNNVDPSTASHGGPSC